MTSRSDKIWRVIDVFNWSRDFLRDKGVESPQVETEWILRDVLNCSRMDIYLRHEQPLDADELARIRAHLQQRGTGKPLQYVLGYTEFMGLLYQVSPAVLIPRIETEVVVEKLIPLLATLDEDSRILDVGCGSGNIIISLLHFCQNTTGMALDISPSALQLAEKNARANGVFSRLQMQEMDILADAPDQRFDCIVSNPPYIDAKRFAALDPMVRDFEPQIALKPKGEELSFYRRLVALAPRLLNQGGILAVEIGGDYQEAPVRRIFESAGLADIQVITDYLPQSRGVIARWN